MYNYLAYGLDRDRMISHCRLVVTDQSHGQLVTSRLVAGTGSLLGRPNTRMRSGADLGLCQ